MKKKFQPANTGSASASKWPQALLLSVGLTGLCMQVQAADDQRHITSDQNTEITVINEEVVIDSGVSVSIANMNDTPIVSISDRGVLYMEPDSKLVSTIFGIHDGIRMQNGKAELDNAEVTVSGRRSAVLMDGNSEARLVNSNVSASTDGYALYLQNGNVGEANSVSVIGGTLSSDGNAAIYVNDNNATVTLNETDVSGRSAIHVTGGADATNTINVTKSTLTGGRGPAVLMDGSSTVVNLVDTTVTGASDTAATVSIDGRGNVFNMTGGTVNVTGTGADIVSALDVNAGEANVTGAGIIANGNGAQGVHVHSGAEVNLQDVHVSTSGDNSHGISGADANGKIVVSGGSITTEGVASNGLDVRAGLNAKVTGTRIDIGGSLSNGIVVGSDAVAEIRDSVINMTHSAFNNGDPVSRGAAYLSDGAGAQLKAVNVNVTAAGKMTGLIAAGGAAEISGGSIATDEGHGAIVTDGANVVINNGARISTNGTEAHAILIHGDTLNTLVIDGATLSTENAQADIIQVGGGVADVTIRNGAKIDTDGNLLNVQSVGGINSRVRLVADGVDLRGNILADSDSTADVFLQNGTVLTGTIDPVALTIDKSSAWNVTGNSELSSLRLDGGAVNFGQPQNGVFKTVQTDSLEGPGGRILMNATLGDGSGGADLLHVTGDSGGVNVLDVRNAGGTGAQTVGDGIHLVQVDGESDPSNFTLEGRAVQVGLYEYFLTQGGQSRAKDWYLRSTTRAALPGYVMTPTLNRNYGFSTIGTLHERIGDLGNLVRSEKDGNGRDGVWARISGGHLRTGSSEQIDASARSSFMQFGKDWTLSTDAAGTSTHAGATLTLGEMHASFSDDKRLASGSPVGRDTGTAKTRAAGVGGYWTRYFADGAYLDAVGQLTRYGIAYKDAYAIEANSKGTGLALSVEAGKPFASYGSLRMEAQGQMIYQFMRTDKFNDGISEIAANSNHAARARLGVRVFREMQTGGDPLSAAPYAIFNIWRNINGASSIGIDGQSLQTQTNKNWGEIGVGISGRVSRQGMLHASLKYRHQLGGQQFEGTAGEIGYRYNW